MRAANGALTQFDATMDAVETRPQAIIDDGRGIDWQEVATRANSAGLSAPTREELEQALFVDGLSTAASVTDVSGRGVGMGALLAATKAMDEQLSVRSESQQGTTLHFGFPARGIESVFPRAASSAAKS